MGELLDFLAQWPSRKAPDELVLLGLPLFWWNRIGGIMQFIGGSFIIAEIVGFDRISKYSNKITNALSKIVALILVVMGLWVVLFYDPSENILAYVFFLLTFLPVMVLGNYTANNVYRLLNSPRLNKFFLITSFMFVLFGPLLQLLAA